MLKPEARAVYNFRIPEMVIWFSRVRRFARPFLLVLWFVCHAAPCLSETEWAGPEQKLVQKIVAVCGPGTMALDIENREAIRAVLSEAGAPVAGFFDFLDGDGRIAHERIQRQAEEIGVFGVPTFVVDGEIFWGGDRLWMVREKLGAPPPAVSSSTRPSIK